MKAKVHRDTINWTPCGRLTGEVKVTRVPAEVTCAACRRIQDIPNAIIPIPTR